MSVFEHFIFFTSLSRCEDAEAFEVQDGGKSTGIFTKYLNTHILQSEKVTHVLEKVSEGTYLTQSCVFIYGLLADARNIPKMYC